MTPVVPPQGPAGCTVFPEVLGLSSTAEKPLGPCICRPAHPLLVQNCWLYVCAGVTGVGGCGGTDGSSGAPPDLCRCPCNLPGTNPAWAHASRSDKAHVSATACLT